MTQFQIFLGGGGAKLTLEKKTKVLTLVVTYIIFFFEEGVCTLLASISAKKLF